MKSVSKLGGLAAAGLGVAAVVSLVTGTAPALAGDAFTSGAQPTANPRAGVEDNVLASDLDETPVAWGQLPVGGAASTLGNTDYGYNTGTGGPLTQDPHEAYKTEPDKNVYLVVGGHHFLYQGHEGGPAGYVTRVDLDQSEPAKRVSLVAEKNADGSALPNFDGITWDPFTHQLLLTAESSYPKGGVWAVSLDSNGDGPADLHAQRLTALGSGGYEGIQNDDKGNVWLVEDVGGAGVSGGKKPNSYVYRFHPGDKTDLSNGKLEALQVLRDSSADHPATAAQLQQNPSDDFITQLHTCGTSFRTRWVTVNVGDGSGDAAGFNATAKASAAGATPFKRPENGVFRPGTGFGEFFFTETGDTSKNSTLPGAYGAVFKLSMPSPNADTGTITAVTVGDLAHTGFDNISFVTADQLLVVEDAGDTLHAQRNALDSGYVVDVTSTSCPTPKRFLAEGRDGSATYDALFSPGYNDGDNEITGIHTSDGDPTPAGILGAKTPTPFSNGWRVFWTQQHGDNVTWELHRS